MKILPLVISSFAKYMTSGEAFDRMRDAVVLAEDAGASGAEKRESAMFVFKAFGLDLAEWLSNLLLELAVAWLKQAQQKG